MEIANLIEEKEKNKIYGLIGNLDLTTNHENIGIITEYKFKGTVKEYLNSNKDLNSLKLVMLEEDTINKNIEELSSSEIKAVNLAKALIDNKEYLILNYFEKNFTYNEKENYKRIFKKLVENYHKTIVIYTNDITFLWELCHEIIYVDNNVVTNYSKEDYFKLIEQIPKPEISKAIDLIREKNIKIEDYKDTKDLLKAIFRIKEKETCDI